VSTTEKKTRIHLVKTPTGNRLVRAATKNAAIRHVAAGLIECSVASQDDLVAQLGADVQIEDASEPAAE
jgi:hypothetical protein